MTASDIIMPYHKLVPNEEHALNLLKERDVLSYKMACFEKDGRLCGNLMRESARQGRNGER